MLKCLYCRPASVPVSRSASAKQLHPVSRLQNCSSCSLWQSNIWQPPLRASLAKAASPCWVSLLLIMLSCCRSIHKPKLPTTTPLLLSLFGSLLSMPTKDGAGSLPYTVAVLIGTYSDWLAETLRHGSQGQAQGSGQAQGQQLVSQLLQLLMQCTCPTSA